MSNELVKIDPKIISELVLKGDVSSLTPTQRVEYVTKLCERIGVDPLTQPFKIIKFREGKETLYADKGCAQQLCKVYDISTEVKHRERIDDVYVVTVRASIGNRFTDEDGAVTIGTSKGDVLANALMKAVTKAKRRAVLSLCGLGMLDETEIETIKDCKTSDLNNDIPMPIAKVTEEPKVTVEPCQSVSRGVVETALKKDELVDISPKVRLITESEGKALIAQAKKNGYDLTDVKVWAATLGYERLSHMNNMDYEDAIKYVTEMTKEQRLKMREEK